MSFELLFDTDAFGILVVTAMEKVQERVENVHDYTRKVQLKRMIEDAEELRLEQVKRKEAIRAKTALEEE